MFPMFLTVRIPKYLIQSYIHMTESKMFVFLIWIGYFYQGVTTSQIWIKGAFVIYLKYVETLIFGIVRVFNKMYHILII